MMIYDVAPIAIFGIVFGIAALIALIALILYKKLHLKSKEDDVKPTEEEILKEEMNRYLQPIDDEEVAKKVNDYQEKDD